MAGQSLIDAGDIAAIGQIQLDAMETAFALQKPPILISLDRRVAGVTVSADPVRVVMTFDRTRVGSTDDTQEGVADAPITGRLRAYAPWDVKRNDRFTLPDGRVGVIDFAPPAQAGIQRATFTIDVGR